MQTNWRQGLAAYVAGLIAAFWPYTLSHHNHPNLIFIGFVPLVLPYIRRTITDEKRPWRNVLLLGLFIALVGFTRWQLLIMAGFLLVFYAGYLLWQKRDTPTAVRRHVAQLLAANALALLLMLPLLFPLLTAQLTRDDPADLAANEQRTGQTDLLAYLTPSRYHPLWGEAVFPLTENYTVDRVFTPFLGFTTLFLAVCGAIAYKREARFWLMATLLYILLALGGYLQINGQFTLPLPYLLLEEMFVGAMIRRPSRLNVILSLPLAMLAAFGVRYWLTKSPRARFVVPLLFIPLILFEYVVTYPTYPLTTPAWYAEMAREPDNFAILDLPRHPRIYDEQYMFYQFTHGRPLVGGHVSRLPAEALSFIDSVEFLRDFPSNGEPKTGIRAPGEQLRRLAAQNVRYLVLHKQFLGDDTLQRWRAWLAIAPAHEDEAVLVYRTAVQRGREYTLTDEFLPGVGVAHSVVTPTATTQEGWLAISAMWASDTSLPASADICLSLTDAAGRAHQTDCHAPARPTDSWEAGEIIRAAFQMQVSPYLPSGTYQVTAVFSPTLGGEAVTLGEVALTAVPRTFDAPDPEILVADTAVWGDDLLQLYGYDMAHNPQAQTIELTLHWLAQQRPTHSYALFVHLIDPATEEIVAQWDAAPRNWGYPTNWWEAGEFVTDEVQVDVTAVLPGTYTLKIGWYDVGTLTRLPIGTGDTLTLTDVTVP